MTAQTSATRGRDEQQQVPWIPLIFAIVITAIIALLAFYLGGRALTAIDLLQVDMDRISQRLETLETMNRRMGIAVSQLDRANAQLIVVDKTLNRTNRKLDGTSATVSQVTAELGTIAIGMRSIVAMRSDVDTLTHKIDNSFLFRGVKNK